MKRIKLIISIVSIILLFSALTFVLCFFNSPEYALIKTSSDIKVHGLDGLKPHVTGEAKCIVELISKAKELSPCSSSIPLIDNPIVSELIKSKIDEIKWDVIGIEKNGNQAIFTIAVGLGHMHLLNVDLIMVRESDSWVISKIR